MDEAGYKCFAIEPWIGLMVQKKTPAAIVEKLNRASNEALTDPDVARRLADMETTPRGVRHAHGGGNRTLGKSDHSTQHTGRRTEMTES